MTTGQSTSQRTPATGPTAPRGPTSNRYAEVAFDREADAVATALIAAATTCGLPGSEAITTINSGLAAGRRNPRELAP